jgi:hypothetical protein
MLRLALASMLFAQPPDVAAPAPAPTYAPAPVPAPAPAPTYAQPQPYVAPAPAPPPPPKPSDGVGLLVTGPLLVVAGVPLSLFGNTLWRDNCGPTSSDRRCADGSFASAGMHSLAGLGYGLGIGFTGMGAARHANYSVYAGRDPASQPLIVAGAVLLPVGLLGMGMVRLLMWLPTPECMTYACVRSYQDASSFGVGAGALIAGAGAGMLMYGTGLERAKRRYRLSFAPRFGREFAGLELRGRF